MKTPSGPTRLGYRMATGQGLPSTDTSTKTTPKFARGGLAKAGSFKQGVVTTAAKSVGTVKTTSNIKGHDPKGFKLHAPKKV